MSSINKDTNSGALIFTPSQEEKNSLDLRRDIRSLKDSINKLSKDLDDVKYILMVILETIKKDEL